MEEPEICLMRQENNNSFQAEALLQKRKLFLAVGTKLTFLKTKWLQHALVGVASDKNDLGLV
jgi:hypothetical protein